MMRNSSFFSISSDLSEIEKYSQEVVDKRQGTANIINMDLGLLLFSSY